MKPLTAAMIAVQQNPDLLRGPQGVQGVTGRTGVRGQAGPGLTWRGPWRSTEDYSPGDVVEFEGSAYVAVSPSIAVRPPASVWDLLAKKGAPGPAGPQGSRGGSGSAGSSSLAIQDEGTPVVSTGTVDFAGAGVSVAQVGAKAVVTVPGGVASQDIEEVLTEGNDAGGQVVTNLGQVTVNPGPAQLYGLLIESLAGFYAVYNAFIRVKDEDGIEVFNVDQGGFDMVAPAGAGGGIHAALRETSTNARAELSTFNGLSLTDAPGLLFASLSTQKGLELAAFVPSEAPGVSKAQTYYDSTNGAAYMLIRGKTADGTAVTGRLRVGHTVQTYTESNVTTDRTFNANATSIDELADVLGTLIADLRAQGVVA